MKLKTKIFLGLLILFIAVTLLGVLGSYNLDKTAKDSLAMMRDNYNTLKYTREMSSALSEMVSILSIENYNERSQRIDFQIAAANFKSYLELQLKNVTEQDEENITEEIRTNFEDFKKRVLDSLSTSHRFSFEVYIHGKYLNDLLNDVYEMNEKAILAKTEEANAVADKITLFMIIVAFFFFGFALFSLIYFPSYIADPIKDLTKSIKQIAQKNYNQRLPVKSGDELGEMASSFNLMAEKLEEYESFNIHQIVTEKQRIETIINQMNEAIIGIDADHNILFVNPIAEALLGIKEEEMVGKRAGDMAQQNEVFANLVKETLRSEIKKDTTFSSVSIDKNGKKLYFNKDILIVQNPDNQELSNTNVGYVIILKNITELKEHDLAKTNFMATLSHELKTPISAIGMSLGLMEDERIGDLNEEQKDLANTIRHNTARLLKMVNEILDISKIETGNIQLNYENIAPENVVNRAIDNVKTFVVEKNINVKKLVGEDVPTIKLDVLKTTGVLTNFLTNALRYSNYGEEIHIDVNRKNGSVEFLVKDFGKGISEEDKKKIFQKYRRAKNDKTKGTGLGLAISKEFIEAQGGSIWVNSRIGEGSTFGFRLPVK